MAFEKYINVPINVITTNTNETTTTSFALAKDFSFGNRTSLNQYRILGKKTQHTQYTPVGNQEVDISMNLYVDPSLDTVIRLFKLAQVGDGFTLKIGDTWINYCYIDSISFTVSPFQPVVVAVSCKAYDLDSVAFVPSTDINLNSFDIANGAKSEVNVDGFGTLDILEASISINSEREIFYTPGSLVPMRCDLISSELTAQITAGGVGPFINYEGQTVNLNFEVRTLQGLGCFYLQQIINDTSGLIAGRLPCVCTSQDLSMDEGGFISGSINLNSILV